MEGISTDSVMVERLGRWLYDNSSSTSDEEALRNRILYIAYLCVLGCCCITPCLYYIRVSSWQRRQFREFREMERNAIIAALAQSAANNTRMNLSPESAAVHSERRARIIQLMEPVRMTLQEKHFQRSPSKPCTQSINIREQEVQCVDTKSNLSEQKQKPDDVTEELTIPPSLDSGFDYEEETVLIQVPCPGLNVRSEVTSDGTVSVRGTARSHTRRSVPGFCTICLSAFEVGHDIVWSSNSQCDHCFHTDCMQQWLTKQQRSINAEGPVCPCCRRDFVIDPYDLISVQSPRSEVEPDRIHVPNSPVDTDESSLTCPLGDDERRTSNSP